MIGRRAVLGAALVAALAGCAQVDAGMARKVAKLQEQYGHEQGVTSVSLSASLKNESFTTIWNGEATLAEGLGVDDQARLLARLFELATSLGLPAGQFDRMVFHLPGASQVNVMLFLDRAKAADLAATLALAPGANASLDDQSCHLNVTLAAADLVSFVGVATPILTIAQPASFRLVAGAQYGTFPDQSSLATDHAMTPGELAFLPQFTSWLAVHRTTEYQVVFSDSEQGIVHLYTVADETDAVKALAAAGQALRLRSEYWAYLEGGQVPYLKIPRG